MQAGTPSELAGKKNSAEPKSKIWEPGSVQLFVSRPIYVVASAWAPPIYRKLRAEVAISLLNLVTWVATRFFFQKKFRNNFKIYIILAAFNKICY